MGRGDALAALAVVCLVVLAGCGGAADAPTAGTTETAEGEGTTAPPANGTLEVHFIDVGQSASTLLVSPAGETMLIDTGNFANDGEHVLRYLDRLGIERIDHLVVSHNDADHIGGNAAVIEHFETEGDGVGAVYDPGIAASTRTYDEYLDAVETHDVPLFEVREGDRIPFAGVDVDVFGPPEPYLANGERNENSVVLKVSHGETSFLFTGDAETAQEEYLVDTYGAELRATVLTAGHHGSRGSTGDRLLDAVSPEAVVISSAYDSQYGHPHRETLLRLAARLVPTLWTGVHGDVVFESDGETVTVRAGATATTNPLALRDADPIPPGTTDPTSVLGTIDPGGRGTLGAAGPAPDDDSPLAVATFRADAPGDDRENLNGEYVTFENRGEEPIDLSGWTVADEAGRTYEFPDGVVLDPGETVTLYTGSGTDTDSELYWGSKAPIWNNDGDTLVVTNAQGELVLTETYP